MTLDNAPSMSEEVREEQTWAAAGEKLGAANLVERLINAKERELQGVIASNYSRVRDVERELSQLQLQLKITAGPKRSALEHLRKKIELQNIKVVAARDRNRVAKQAAKVAEESLQAEEKVKNQLCQELNTLVQQSAHAQLDKLDQLMQRLQILNQDMGHKQEHQLEDNQRTQSPSATLHANGSPQSLPVQNGRPVAFTPISASAACDMSAAVTASAAAAPPLSPLQRLQQGATENDISHDPSSPLPVSTAPRPSQPQPAPEALAARSRHITVPGSQPADRQRGQSTAGREQQGPRKPSPRVQRASSGAVVQQQQQQPRPVTSQGRFSGFD